MESAPSAATIFQRVNAVTLEPSGSFDACGNFRIAVGKSSQNDDFGPLNAELWARHKYCSFHFAKSQRCRGGVETREESWAMKTFKMMTLATVVALMVAGFALISAAAGTDKADDFDPAATYKAKCVACHGAAAEKKFNNTLSDAELVEAVLKGKKGEKPPNMPGYEEKGINEEQAKALVAHMKSLKQ
jgi:mono/diheme cytochrome c family protein